MMRARKRRRPNLETLEACSKVSVQILRGEYREEGYLRVLKLFNFSDGSAKVFIVSGFELYPLQDR